MRVQRHTNKEAGKRDILSDETRAAAEKVVRRERPDAERVEVHPRGEHGIYAEVWTTTDGVGSAEIVGVRDVELS